MGYDKNDKPEREEEEEEGGDEVYEIKNNKRDSITFGHGNKQSDKKKKSVKIQEGETVFGVSKTIEAKREPASRSQSRGRSYSPFPKKKEVPIVYDSPRRKLYEAKFEKFVANKENKVKVEKKLETMAKEDFDLHTKGEGSPSKQTYRYKVTRDKKGEGNRYDSEQLMPKSYDEDVLQKQRDEDDLRRSMQTNKDDQFRELGVANEDKMTFFLLKWVFNAIKRDSALDDTKLMGSAYVTKTDLVK